MPRGQEAKIQTGGGIDPYVQSSVQQSKQQRENRILTAMKEKGATQRTAMTTSAQLAGQQMQMQGEMAQTTARGVQEDKRAAEAEVGRREDMEFRKATQESNQTYQNEILALQKEEQEMSRMGQEWSKEQAEYAQALKELELQKEMRIGENQTNLAISTIEAMGKSLAAKEKTVTTGLLEKDKFERQIGAYENTKKETLRRVELDKRWDDSLAAREPRPAFRGAGAGMTYALPEEKRAEAMADPMGILQDEFNANNVGFSAEDASPEKINNLKDKVVAGEVTEVEITKSIGVLEGMIQAVGTKLEKVDAKTQKSDYDFWKKQQRTFSAMKDSIAHLRFNDDLIKGSETKKVRMVITSGLGPTNPTYAPSFGAQMFRGTESGIDIAEVIAGYRKATDPTSALLFDSDPTDSPAMIRAKKLMNDSVYRTYPQLNQQEEEFGLPED